MIISERIHRLIREKGMTQKDFSMKTGIPQSTICDWKRKKINPSADRILKISEVLDVNLYYLLSGEGEKEPDALIVMKDDEKYEVVREVLALDEEQQKRIMAYAQTLKETEK